jgi:subtilisin-like proprotein convertase family protein
MKMLGISVLRAGGVMSRAAAVAVLALAWAQVAQAAPAVTFRFSSHTNAPGATVTARVSVNGFTQVTSAQFTMQWDPAVLQFLGTGGYNLGGLGGGSFGTTLTNIGKLTLSWDDPSGMSVTVPDGTVIFTVSYRAVGPNGSASALAFIDNPTMREVAVNYEVATFVSVTGGVLVFTNDSSSFSVQQTNRITINDYSPATPYPSSLIVSNLTGVVRKATVTLNGLSHTWPDDIGVLLVGPGGQKVELMGDAGGSQPVTGQTITFDDDAAAGLPDEGVIVSGTYKPGPSGSSNPFWPPAPAQPYNAALSAFVGSGPNGAWSLYVQDIAAGDFGNIAGGWTLTLTLGPGSPRPVFLPTSLRHYPNGQCSFKLAGEAGATYEIQASSDLKNWKVLKTVLMTNSPLDVMDLNSNVVRRCYRARFVQ